MTAGSTELEERELWVSNNIMFIERERGGGGLTADRHYIVQSCFNER